MLALTRLRQGGSPFLRQSKRLVSTTDALKIINSSKEAELKIEPEQAFSVFPRIQDIQTSDLVGNNAFGKYNYYVERSGTGNLPVYLDIKNGGNVVTELRKIRGNVVQLRDDLQEQLPHIPKKNWKCITQSNKIIIKGDFAQEVKKILKNTF